jgi:hypothetical protein
VKKREDQIEGFHMKKTIGVDQMIGLAVASGLGVLIALLDRAELFGDDSSKPTMVLWLACSGILGFALPRSPWLWMVSVGPWLPAMYLILHALDLHPPIKPDTYTSSFMLMAVSLVVCALGSYGGAFVRRITWPPSRSIETLPGTGA